jgi:hypothetical protein
MKVPVKSLKQLKKEAKGLGYGVRGWAELAEMPYQVVYRRLNNEKNLRLDEYLKLEEAVEKMRNDPHYLPA